MKYLDIIQSISSKDQKGLEVLYMGYGTKFYQYAVNKWELEEDEAWQVVYQTLETLVLKLPEYSFDSQDHFDNFVFKVFVNFLRQFFRSHRKHQHDIVYVDFTEQEMGIDDYDSLDETQDQVHQEQSTGWDYISNTHDETESNENPNLVLMKHALSQFSETEQNILLLRAQNYTYEEIATMLQFDNNQLKVRHHRIKKKLKKTLLNLLTDDHAKATQQ